METTTFLFMALVATNLISLTIFHYFQGQLNNKDISIIELWKKLRVQEKKMDDLLRCLDKEGVIKVEYGWQKSPEVGN